MKISHFSNSEKCFHWQCDTKLFLMRGNFCCCYRLVHSFIKYSIDGLRFQFGFMYTCCFLRSWVSYIGMKAFPLEYFVNFFKIIKLPTVSAGYISTYFRTTYSKITSGAPFSSIFVRKSKKPSEEFVWLLKSYLFSFHYFKYAYNCDVPT